MLQSSSSSSPLGQSVAVSHHHYKKFWILQTMMDQSKLQDQACNNHTATTTANFSGSSISVATPLTPTPNSHQNNNMASSPSSTATSTFRSSASFNSSSDNFSSHTNSDHQACWSNDSPQSQLVNPAVYQSLTEIPATERPNNLAASSNDKFTTPEAANSCSITHTQRTTQQRNINNSTYNLTRIRNRMVNNVVVIDRKSNDLFSSGGGRNFVVRTCTLCGTTKTPLWRSGPEGPKSLCNACGIRVKKSRRLQMAMESERLNDVPIPSPTPKPSTTVRPVKRKYFCNDNDHDESPADDYTTNIVMKTKRKDQIIINNNKNVTTTLSNGRGHDHDEDAAYYMDATLPWSSNRDSGFGQSTLTMSDASAKVVKLLNNHRRMPKAFAKDEEEAAMLLMALSCGLALS